MKATVTIKLTAETKDELINTFALQTQEFKRTIELDVAQNGINGIGPDHVELRWMFETGVWA